MNVIYVAHSTSLLDGSSKALINTIDGMILYGIHPLIILPDKNGLYDLFLKKGIPVKSLKYRMAIYPYVNGLRDLVLFLPRLFARISLNYLAAFRLMMISKSFKPDLIHTNVSVIDIGFNVAMKLKIPHVWHIREYGSLDFNYYYYFSRASFLRKLNVENSYSICITRDIQKYNQLCDSSRSFVIYDGVLSVNDILFKKCKQKYFLYAGRLEPNKGILNLLYSFADFNKIRPDSSIRLLVAGDTPNKEYYNYLKSVTQNLNISGVVDFLGMRRDILDLMSKAYLMIVPSLSEGFGFITSEAMFSGALVVGYNVAGTKEQFDNGFELCNEEIGLRYSTSEDLVNHMCEVVDKGIEWYIPMIKCAQKVVSNLYSKEQYIDNIYKLYTNILNQK